MRGKLPHQDPFETKPPKRVGLGEPEPQPARRARRGEALRIAGVYFVVGCAWIIISDLWQGASFAGSSGLVLASMIKGLLFILVTAVLVYTLAYRAFGGLLKSREIIEQMNRTLEETNQSYEELVQELDRKQALLKALIDSIPDFIFYKDGRGVYRGCNKAFERFAGRPEAEIVGRTDFELFSEERAWEYVRLDEALRERGGPISSGEQVALSGGETAYLDTVKSSYYDVDGTVIGLIGVTRDITEHKAREERIAYLSYHDALTGVYNRAYFLEARERLDREEYYPLSLISGDVNGTKLINDAFGHARGDALLQQIAEILTACTRPGDVVARTGGDEFLILLPNTDLRTAGAIAERIRGEVRRRHLEAGEVHPDIAMGYATKEVGGMPFEQIMTLAEDLMYRRKLLEQKSLHSSILASIMATMYEKSNETEEHCERLAQLSRRLGEAVGFPESKMDELELLAMLHDIGKINVDQDILTKAGPLTPDEWREIKKHPEVGYRIANSNPELRHIADGILCHHERWDGAGYLQGLAGEQIPLMARIIAITDSYDAMTQDRAYRKAISREEALAEITRNAGTQFDPFLAAAFVRIMEEKPAQVTG